MSNHRGGYMLNEVIALLDQAKVLELLGPETTRQLLKDIVELAERHYDCNGREIMEGHAKRLGVCSECFCSAQISSDDICFRCAKEIGYPQREFREKRSEQNV